MADLNIEEFLGHDPSAGGFERGKFLRGWKKRKPKAEVNLWLHTQVMFSSLWLHNLQRVVTRKDRETGDEKHDIWGNSWTCWEHESTLSNRKRDYNTGEREEPFQICPVCKMIDWVRRAVRQGSLGGADPIFRYVTPDGQVERTIHAAGIYGGLEDVPQEERDAAKIKLSEAWQENGNAKCNYVFCVVDHDFPEDGVQVAVETQLVGDKTKAVIRRKRKKNGEDSDWNPLATPYAICWEHHASAKKFDDKYEADDRPLLKLTPDVEALIKGEPPTDQLDRLKAPGRLRELRDQLEHFSLIEMPWEEFFSDAEAKEKERLGEDADFAYGANVEPEGEVDPDAIAKADAAMAAATKETTKAPPVKPAPTQAAPKPVVAKPAPATTAAKPAPAAKPAEAPKPKAPSTRKKKVDVKPPVEEVMIKCDDCPQMMREDWDQCPGCGATYEVEPAIKAKYANAAPPPKPDAGTFGDKIVF